MCFQTCKGPRRSINPMTGYVSENLDEEFFWDCKYVTQYVNAPATTKFNMPGTGYYGKVTQFFQ